MTPGYQGSISEDMNHDKHEKSAGAGYAPGVESQNPSDDKRLENEILDYLRAHPDLDVTQVELYVKNGYVSINGKVDNIDAKSTIEALVSNVEGVIDVVNFLQLHSPFESGSDDISKSY